MSCAEIHERLPWFANGSLDEAERRRVREHLSGCAACRRALAESVESGDAATTHLPIATLLDLADGEPLDAADRAAAEDHLAICPACSEELRRARHRPATQPVTRPATDRQRPRNLWPAVAAALLMTTAASLFFALRPQPPQLVLNPPVIELVADSARRGGDSAGRLEVTPAGPYLSLLLISDRADDAPLRLELIAPDGAVVTTRSGLRRSPQGLYSLLLPSADLAPGEHQILIYGTGEAPLERFRFEIAD